MPIFYTPKQAGEALAEVRAIVNRIMAVQNDADRANDREMGEAMTRLHDEVQKLEELGCILRDPSVGLVDFPAVRLGERVWLCWKFGEDRISFWHTSREGYAGRKRIEEKEFYDDDLAIRSLNREAVSKAHP